MFRRCCSPTLVPKVGAASKWSMHGKGQTLQVPSTLEEYYAAGGSLVAQGYLNPVEQEQSSTWRELIAIERTLWSLLKDVSLTVVRLFTDNLAVHYVWLAGSIKKIIQGVVRCIFEFCHERSTVGGHDRLTDCLPADMMDRLDCPVGACSRERAV